MNEVVLTAESPARKAREPVVLSEHIIEVISDSGEGAQRCGQSLGAIAARSGNGVWTVEIIPAEIRPPARSVAGASGNRIRIGTHRITNGGGKTDLVVAFNEQVLLGRVHAGELKPGATILLEDMWRENRDPAIVEAYRRVHDQLVAAGYDVREIPMERECRKLVSDAKRGKNMFALGMICRIYSFSPEVAHDQIGRTFAKKGAKVIDQNVMLFDAGYAWAGENIDLHYMIPSSPAAGPQMVINGNQALALGVLASGMELCAMYPITPATSASHYLSDVFENVGGMVHQAEDEISAASFALGASYAGKCTVTITSGPGLSLKQEALGLAVMGEVPMVVIDVQRGGPSTGQPTKVEQGDMFSVMFGSHGDAPKVVMAPSTIEECFHSVITARRIAETFRMVVVILSDASLATSQQPVPRPEFDPAWVAAPLDLSPVGEGAKPYDWDAETGLSRRFIPGQPGGMFAMTGLAHDRASHVAYDPEINQTSLRARSLKLAALERTLRPPKVHGPEEGDLLVMGWGSTRGAIEEAVDGLIAEGHRVASVNLTFLQPMQPGLKEIMQRYRRVMTIEGNYSDDPADAIINADNRRYSHLAMLLRARTLVDVDCWSEVKGQPIKPDTIRSVMLERLKGDAS